MSERNGEKSRFQINRKRAVLRRAKIRAMVAAGAPESVGPRQAEGGEELSRGYQLAAASSDMGLRNRGLADS